jgi:hypothetical protein
VWSAESGALLWDLSTSEPRHQGMASQCCAMTGNGSYVMRGTGDGPLLVHALETKVPHVHILHKSDRLVTGMRRQVGRVAALLRIYNLEH